MPLTSKGMATGTQLNPRDLKVAGDINLNPAVNEPKSKFALS